MSTTDYVPTASTAAPKPAPKRGRSRSRKQPVAAAASAAFSDASTTAAPDAAPQGLRPEVEALLAEEAAQEATRAGLTKVEVVDAVEFFQGGATPDTRPLSETRGEDGRRPATVSEREHALAQVTSERNALQAGLNTALQNFEAYVGGVTRAPVHYMTIMRHPATHEVEVWWHPESDPIAMLMAAVETVRLAQEQAAERGGEHGERG